MKLLLRRVVDGRITRAPASTGRLKNILRSSKEASVAGRQSEQEDSVVMR